MIRGACSARKLEEATWSESEVGIICNAIPYGSFIILLIVVVIVVAVAEVIVVVVVAAVMVVVVEVFCMVDSATFFSVAGFLLRSLI